MTFTSPDCVSTLAANSEILTTDFGLKIYPNPVGEYLIVSFNLKQQELVAITMFNLSGRKIDSIESKSYKSDKVDIAYNCKNLIAESFISKTNDLLRK